MSDKEEVFTEFGDIEVNTVECSSCGNIVAKENADQLILGDFSTRYENEERTEPEYYIKKRRGCELWLCEFCREDGPSGVKVSHIVLPWYSLLVPFVLGFVVSTLIARYGFVL